VLTRSHFLWAHEPCFYGWRKGMQPEKDRRPEPSQRTVWEIDQKGQQDGIHPTQKPLEVFEGPIRWHTRHGEICMEPFSGSGTQLIAAERLGRRCFAMEASPAYVDVAVKRWEGATGRDAVLEGEGGTFNAVQAQRAALTKESA
jgi:DNA modification methylase